MIPGFHHNHFFFLDNKVPSNPFHFIRYYRRNISRWLLFTLTCTYISLNSCIFLYVSYSHGICASFLKLNFSSGFGSAFQEMLQNYVRGPQLTNRMIIHCKKWVYLFVLHAGYWCANHLVNMNTNNQNIILQWLPGFACYSQNFHLIDLINFILSNCILRKNIHYYNNLFSFQNSTIYLYHPITKLWPRAFPVLQAYDICKKQWTRHLISS